MYVLMPNVLLRQVNNQLIIQAYVIYVMYNLYTYMKGYEFIYKYICIHMYIWYMYSMCIWVESSDFVYKD